jgi:serine/threonine-protein kinase RsbW
MGVARSRHPRNKTVGAARKASRSARVPAASASDNHRLLVFDIPSDPAATRDVQKQVIDRLESLGYDEQNVFAIRLALEEGLMNAIKHGNKLDRRKSVHVEAKLTPQRAQITIDDQGKGFERTTVPDPCCEENILRTSGRGILLMEAYMDKVQYTRGGRRVKLVKKNA